MADKDDKLTALNRAILSLLLEKWDVPDPMHQYLKGPADESPYACPACGRRLEFRVGKKGEFLSCSGYNESVAEPEPEKPTAKAGKGEKAAKKPRIKKPRHIPACSFAIPVDGQRRPLLPQQIDLLSPAGVPMVKRNGRFGDFLVEDKPRPPKPKGEQAANEPPPFILNLDREGNIKLPAPPPMVTAITCKQCQGLLNLRDGKRGLWLGCQNFPKCRGRVAFAELPETERKDLEHQLKEYLANQEQIRLTRRDGVTPVPDGTPVDDLTSSGGFADLPPWTG